MTFWNSLSKEQLKDLYATTLKDYEACKGKGLKLDMSRGKPGSDQLDLSNDMLSMSLDTFKCDGVETRNYGVLEGLESCRELFAQILGVQADQVFIGGNASLNLMYDIVAKAYTHGLKNSPAPWAKLDKVKFLCPVPGYDRHFTISSTFGMEMITIPMNEDGPDMDRVEEAVKDPLVKGIWCVPKFSNPQGIVYGNRTIERMAALKPAAPDFTILWDNAYVVHEFDGEFVPLPDIISACAKAGNPDMVYEFASTSKITFPGAGVAAFASSVGNIEYMKKLISAQTIGYDKINQYRHVRYFKNLEGVLDHMGKHAKIMRPKFDIVIKYLDERVAPYGIASYHRPKGGYFVSLETMPGCAKRTHALAKEAGVTLTGAGATYPNGKDPLDSNLRIAPSFPPVQELEMAMDVLCTCVKLASLEKLING